MAAVTQHQHATGLHTPASSHIALSPQFAADDLLTLPTADSSLRSMAAHISHPLTYTISTSDLNTSSKLITLHSIKHMLHLRDGVLTYAPEPLTAPKLVVPHSQRRMMLTHAHDAPCAGHHGVKAVSLVPVCLGPPPSRGQKALLKSTGTISCICNSSIQDATHRVVHTLY